MITLHELGKVNSQFSSPAEAKSILVWHQGALGDLLLAGPALAALTRHYAGARITALGRPEPWGLYSRSLPLDGVWDSGEARWVHLFTDGDVPPRIRRAWPDSNWPWSSALTPKPSC